MRKTLTILLVMLALLLFTGLAAADVIYDVVIDTSSVNGSSGYLDFNFAPAPTSSQDATATISNFVGGVLGAPSSNGSVTGSLPGPLALNNAISPPPGNDFFVAFQYGNSLSFKLTFGGPAVNMPDGVSDPSTFAFFMLDGTGAASIVPVDPVQDPSGSAFITDLDNAGGATNTTFASGITLTKAGGPPPMPEPATWTLLSAGLAGLGLLRYRCNR